MPTVKRKDVYRFMKPDEIDRMMKARIAKAKPSARTKGQTRGETSWRDYEIDIRRQVILDLFRQGLSYERVTEEIRARWEISKTCAARYIKDCFDIVTENQEQFIRMNRSIQTQRIEGMLEQCILKENYRDAVKAADLLNKIYGLYSETVNQNVSGEIKFEFGTED